MEDLTNILTSIRSLPVSYRLAFGGGAVVIGVIIKFIFQVIYNLYFHPLSKFPGPKLAAASTLYYAWLYSRGQMVPWIEDCHNKYGDVVRIGPDRLSYVTAEAWRDIYGHRIKGKKSITKDPKFYTKNLEGANVFTIEDDGFHGQIRRIFSHAFSDKALKQQESLLAKHVDHLIFRMRECQQKKGDFTSFYNFTTFDIMGELAFGESLGLLERFEYSPWVVAVFASIKKSAFAQIMREYPLLGVIFRLFISKETLAAAEMHRRHARERVDRRLEKGSDQADIWNLVMTQKEERRLSLDDMYTNATSFMVAGTETTATLLSGLTYYLLMNPEKLQKLVQEIRTTFKSDEELSVNSLKQLNYMNACFEEGLRSYPPVPNGLYRVIPEGGAAICGEYLPEGTRVCVSQYAAYHVESNFKHPNSFIPERWLGDSAFDQDRKEVLQPFSAGPRNCLGKNLAYHEMRLILAKVLWNFDLKLCRESENWAGHGSYLLWEKPPLFVEFTSVH